MENPLTEEQIRRINEIAKLPKEQQQEDLKKFLPTLTQEQIDFLKKQQEQRCLFCSIVNKEVTIKKVYEDNEVIAILDVNPASKGHVLVVPKQHVQYSYDLSTKVFWAANLFAKKLKEVFGYDSNILVANGFDAGQKLDHLIVHIIPRYKEDNLSFDWQAIKLDEKKLDEIAQKLLTEPEEKKEKPRKIEEVDYEEEELIP